MDSRASAVKHTWCVYPPREPEWENDMRRVEGRIMNMEHRLKNARSLKKRGRYASQIKKLKARKLAILLSKS